MTRRMSVQDTLWLNMDRPDNLMTIDCVFWTSAPVTLAQARQTLQERMVDRFPTFRSRPVPAPVLGARAAWEPDPAFDLDRHILAVTLPEPGRAGLERFLSEQRGMPLPGDRPLWLAHQYSGTRNAVAHRQPWPTPRVGYHGPARLAPHQLHPWKQSGESGRRQEFLNRLPADRHSTLTVPSKRKANLLS